MNSIKPDLLARVRGEHVCYTAILRDCVGQHLFVSTNNNERIWGSPGKYIKVQKDVKAFIILLRKVQRREIVYELGLAPPRKVKTVPQPSLFIALTVN